MPTWAAVPLVLIFCLSGASGLAYEVLWTRQLTFVLGGSALAVSTVLAIFMGGLGLGGLLGGRIADRSRNPLLLYAAAELGIGLIGLATPWLLSTSGAIYLGLHSLFSNVPGMVTGSRVLASAAILLVPTTLMGATLPFVVRFFIRRIDRFGRGLGLLYGVNIFGGILGAAYVGYFGILEHGVAFSMHLAVAGNLLAALGATVVALLARKQGLANARADSADARDVAGASPVAGSSDSARPIDRSLLRLLLLSFAVSGFVSIAYQVFWTRALNFSIGTSIYVFTTILVVVLLGLFLGALVAGWIADRTRRPLLWLGWIQWASTAAVLLVYSQAAHLPTLGKTLSERFGNATVVAAVLGKLLPAAIALLVPCFLLGLTFPLTLKVATTRLEDLGERVGRFYAVNTVGAILGSLVAGFVLLPTVGLQRGIVLTALLNAALGLAFFRQAETVDRRRALVMASGIGMAVIASVLIFVQPQPFLAYTHVMKEGNRSILFHEEGRVASVAVTEAIDKNGLPESIDLHINLLGSSIVDRKYFHQQYYATLALLPTALHPSPKKVYVSGVASGVTTGAAALDERTERVVSVEISPEVLSALKFFDDWNYHVLGNPKIQLIADDARAWLATTDERFDIIVTDAFISAITGTCALYSREYFALCRSRLALGGMMSVGCGFLTGTDRTVARTFMEEFPYVAVFAVRKHGVYNTTFLIGSNEPLSFSKGDVEAAYAQPLLRQELTRYFLPDPATIYDVYVGGREDILPHLLDAQICTDDRPVIDFEAVAGAEGLGGRLHQSGPGVQRIQRLVGKKAFPSTP